jgi:hypothetical protein
LTTERPLKVSDKKAIKHILPDFEDIEEQASEVVGVVLRIIGQILIDFHAGIRAGDESRQAKLNIVSSRAWPN